MWIPTHKGEMLNTGFFHRKVHYSDDPQKNENWVKEASLLYGGTNSARWRREMEIDWNVYAGERVWPMLSRQYHGTMIELDKDWAIYRIIDHGIRHPTCCLWVGVNRNGDRHFFREYYATDRPIGVNCKNILSMTSEEVIDTIIDPSTRKRINYITSDSTSEKKGLARLIDIYIENGISCSLGDNASVGYDKVTDGLLSRLARYAVRTGVMPIYLANMEVNQEQLLMLAAKPAITFDLRYITRAYNEMENLRWKELTGDPTQQSSPEKTVDVADEGPDCVRYAMQSDIFWRRPVIRPTGYKKQLFDRFIKRRNKELRPWA